MLSLQKFTKRLLRFTTRRQNSLLTTMKVLPTRSLVMSISLKRPNTQRLTNEEAYMI